MPPHFRLVPPVHFVCSGDGTGCWKGVRSIRRGAAQLWPVNGQPSEQTVQDNGGDLLVEPLGRSVLPFRPIPIGEGTTPPQWGGRTCKFQSVFFLTDSQSALSILSSAPSYLLPESLWNVWSLASSLSNNTSLNFQWVPGHAGLPGNENADLLAKAGAYLPTDAIPCPLPPFIA